MKIDVISARYGIMEYEFTAWLKKSGYKIKSGLLGDSIEGDPNPEPIVKAYKESLAEDARIKAEREAEDTRTKAEREAEEAAAEEKMKAALASMLITSGFNFDGFTIKRYSGYISGDSAVSMDRPTHGWLGGVNKDVGDDILKALSSIRRKALQELKEAAYHLGCNAVIGVDFDYITMDPETATTGGGTLYLPFLFAVTANGNAVVIEKA